MWCFAGTISTDDGEAMKKRFNSLKGMILGSTVFTMMILFLLFAVMMYAEYHTLESMCSTVEKMEVLSVYYETA